MSLIRLKDIRLSYRVGDQQLAVLRSVNLDVQKGEMIAILGPSGSGKSTLLYILGCLLKPTSGEFEFNGRDVTSLNSDQLAELRSQSIGFVFQQFHLLPRANVLENVLLSARYNSNTGRTEAQTLARAKELIAQVGLTEHLDHNPNQLSGGQQQRVAIARALLNEPVFILADEPTGNLDSKSSTQVLEMLRKVNEMGHTVVIITHDAEVAEMCSRVVTIRDGQLETKMQSDKAPLKASPLPEPSPRAAAESLKYFWASVWLNLMRNKGRSILTMLGVTIGIAAVLSTVTLGTYAKKKIMQGYESLGSNKLVFRAYPRWNLKARDIKGSIIFEGVDQINDLGPLKRLLPEILMVSPVVREWIESAEFGGRTMDQIDVLGVKPEYFAITNRRLVLGRPFSKFHSDNHSRVCVIGFDIADRLFGKNSPVGQVIQINGNNNKQYSCVVMGVLASQTSNNEWVKPNKQILMPDSFLSLMASRWNSKPREFNMRIDPNASGEDVGKKIKQFLRQKYGKTVEVNVDSDQLLVEQMRKFLNIFGMLLAGVGFISLGVGGIGITNMMLVSVTERIKEIGLRKALGARDSEIFRQMLGESVILCLLAGLAGILGGIAGYHTILFLSAKLFPKVQFEWVFNWPAMVISTVCIFAVGIGSGIIPALRAQRLEVVEALRNE